jgi:TPP-dependent trihydroxycyclohexane-1,2-dione (THcHDO) dehydratase
MQLDNFKKERIQSVFKVMDALKEDAKKSNASASEAMTNLVAELTADKEERKWLKKSMTKAFKEYQAELNNEPDTLEDAITVINAVCRGNEE